MPRPLLSRPWRGGTRPGTPPTVIERTKRNTLDQPCDSASTLLRCLSTPDLLLHGGDKTFQPICKIGIKPRIWAKIDPVGMARRGGDHDANPGLPRKRNFVISGDPQPEISCFENKNMSKHDVVSFERFFARFCQKRPSRNSSGVLNSLPLKRIAGARLARRLPLVRKLSP